LGAKATFDAPNKLIILDQISPVGGLVTLDVQVDLYSDAREDWKTNVTLNKMRLCFRTTGGDPISAVEVQGAGFFLMNGTGVHGGWRIRPFEADHDLILTGNLFADDETLPIFVPTVGAFTVFARNVQSANTIGIVGGVDLKSIDGSLEAAQNLRKSALTILSGKVDDTAFSPTTTQFESTVTEATPNHFKNRQIVFWDSAFPGLYKAAGEITAYSLVGGRGRFTTTLLPQAPANNAEFVIV